MPRRVTLAFLILASVAVAQTRVLVSAPTVTGPIAWTAKAPDAAHGYTFNPSAIDLASKGYVEEEFFIEGKANRYKMATIARPGATKEGNPTPPAGSALETATLLDADHPYKTRIVVRRPISAKKFNGTAIVEWTNVTGGRDLEMDWFQVADHIVRSGYAWIGVSAQRVGVNALKAWSDARYGSLDVTEGGKITDDALSYDILVATALAVRGKANKDAMGGLKPERVIATGHRRDGWPAT